MDQSVLDAIERWPNVPAVYGWLSLSRRGQWRLHPGGTANEGGFGESIQNQQIIAFMNRNYAGDAQGRWFFQNGPQRVYVRLDAAPLIVSITGQPAKLHTHNGLAVTQIKRWVIDQTGNLFLECEHGPACVIDQDLEQIASTLQTREGQPVMDWWEQQHLHSAHTTVTHASDMLAQRSGSAPLDLLGEQESIESVLGFVHRPQANPEA